MRLFVSNNGSVTVRDADACTIARIEPRAAGAVPSAAEAACLIVRACNSHDALVAALRHAETALASVPSSAIAQHSLSVVRAALAAAEGNKD